MRTLNCNRAARTISLYIAGDLVGAPEREVAAHLAACENCRRFGEEFSESSSLLIQAYRPPEFGAEFYSGIRHAVLGEITRDRLRSKPSLFRPRWLYATAFAAIVIASVVMLQHFVAARRVVPQDLARAPQITDQPASPPEVPLPGRKHELRGKRSAQSSNVLASANRRRSFRHPEETKTPDTLVAAQTTRDISTQVGPEMQSSTNVGPVAPEASSQVSRIEIQTADPNIRIIWLSPRESREPETNNNQEHPETSNRK